MVYTLYLRISPCNKYYVGCTTKTPEARAGEGGIGYIESHMWEDIQKYGWDAFKTEILAQTEDVEEATQLEDYYMKVYDSMNPEHGYNTIKSGGARSAESIRRQSESMHRNLTDPNSYFQSEERREKQSKGIKAGLSKPEVRQKMRDNAKAYWTDEAKKRHSEKMKEVMHRPDVRANYEKAMADPERRARLAESLKRVSNDPERRKATSNHMKARWADPEYRRVQSERIKEAQSRPEVKAKRVATLKARNAQPGEYEKRCARMKVVQSRPEVRAKRSKARKGKVWVHKIANGEAIRLVITQGELESYCQQGYKPGMGPRNKNI